jgi:hypothetical protein
VDGGGQIVGSFAESGVESARMLQGVLVQQLLQQLGPLGQTSWTIIYDTIYKPNKNGVKRFSFERKLRNEILSKSICKNSTGTGIVNFAAPASACQNVGSGFSPTSSQ